jgi:hypothetical protein
MIVVARVAGSKTVDGHAAAAAENIKKIPFFLKKQN